MTEQVSPWGSSVGQACILCHNGVSSGDLFPCAHCRRNYHLDCYIPTLIDEPPDDWTCIMCYSMTEIQNMSNDPKIIGGHLGQRDLFLCRRLMMQIYGKQPESNTFKFIKNIQFPLYLKMIKNPVAMDLIQERLEISNQEQYMSVSKFLNDVRRMFSNCRTFWKNNPIGALYVKQANKLEEHFEDNLKEWQHLINGQLPSKLGEQRSSIIGPASKKTDVNGNPRSSGANFPGSTLDADRPPQVRESYAWNNNAWNSLSAKMSDPTKRRKAVEDDDWDPNRPNW